MAVGQHPRVVPVGHRPARAAGPGPAPRRRGPEPRAAHPGLDGRRDAARRAEPGRPEAALLPDRPPAAPGGAERGHRVAGPSLRSEEHTSELQSLMRISYAVLCLTKKRK